jgi:hypothetical protein
MSKRTVSIIVLTLFLLLFLAIIFEADLAEVKGAKDKTPPIGSIVINNGDQYTTSTSVSLTLTAYDPESGVKQVRYSNTDVWGAWEKISATKSWTLTSGDGVKTVYCQIKNNDNVVSSIYSDTITLKTEPSSTPEPTPTPTPKPTPTIPPSPTPTPTSMPTPTPTIIPTPTPKSRETPSLSIPTPTTTPDSTSAPKNTSTPFPAPKSSLDLKLTDSIENAEGKVLAVIIVLVCGNILLFWSLKLKKP